MIFIDFTMEFNYFSNNYLYKVWYNKKISIILKHTQKSRIYKNDLSFNPRQRNP